MRRIDQYGSKGRMKRVKFQNRPRISRYEVECGAPGCSTVGTFRDPADARTTWKWLRVKDYGWICPKCQEGDPLPEDMSGDESDTALVKLRDASEEK